VSVCLQLVSGVTLERRNHIRIKKLINICSALTRSFVWRELPLHPPLASTLHALTGVPVSLSGLTPVSTAWTCLRTRRTPCCMRSCWSRWRKPAPLGWSEPLQTGSLDVGHRLGKTTSIPRGLDASWGERGCTRRVSCGDMSPLCVSVSHLATRTQHLQSSYSTVNNNFTYNLIQELWPPKTSKYFTWRS